MSAASPIWKKDELERERSRAILVIAIVGTVVAARFFDILPSFTKDLYLLSWVDALYVLVGIWGGYLLLMVFAVSDDVLGALLGAYGRAISFYAKFFGHAAFIVAPFVAIAVALYVSWIKDTRATVVLIVALVFLVAFLWSQRKRVASQFPPDSNQPKQS